MLSVTCQLRQVTSRTEEQLYYRVRAIECFVWADDVERLLSSLKTTIAASLSACYLVEWSCPAMRSDLPVQKRSSR